MADLGDCCPQLNLTTNGAGININMCRKMNLLRQKTPCNYKTNYEPRAINH